MAIKKLITCNVIDKNGHALQDKCELKLNIVEKSGNAEAKACRETDLF